MEKVSYKKAVGIGAIAGFITVFLPLVVFQTAMLPGGTLLGIFAFLILDSVIGIIGIPFGIVGALIGKYFLKISYAAWIGGFAGAILMLMGTGMLGALCPILGGC